MSLFALLAALLLGMAAGFAARARQALVRANRKLTRASLWALLALMGAKMALSRGLFARDFGVLLLSLASSLLMLALYFAGFAVFSWLRPGASSSATAAGQDRGGRELLAVASNCAWILAGFLLWLWLPADWAARLPLDCAGDWLLRLLLVCVGFELGADLAKLDLRRLSLPLLLLPLVNIAASLACGLLLSLFCRLKAKEAMLLYSGMGWYSLSSVLIAERGWVLLSMLAFLHNVFRELLAILTMPWAARVSPYLPIFLGGATAMDVTLPFVQKYCGPEYTLLSFYSGVVCSLAVLPLVRSLI